MKYHIIEYDIIQYYNLTVNIVRNLFCLTLPEVSTISCKSSFEGRVQFPGKAGTGKALIVVVASF